MICESLHPEGAATDHVKGLIIEASFYLVPAKRQKQAVDKLAADGGIYCLYNGQISAGKDPCHQQKPNKPARSALISQFASGSMHAYCIRERLSASIAHLRSSVGPLRRSRQSSSAEGSACEALGIVILRACQDPWQ